METIPATNPSVVVRGPDDFTLEDRPLSSPGPGEVLVRVGAAGICGSDVELFAGTRPAAYVRYPVVPGHEWSGSIAAVGADVDGLDVGDPVVAQGFRNCGRCPRCREGATNLCEAGYAETGFTHPGAFSHYVAVPARLVHRLRPGADLEAAALLEPSACVLEGIRAAAPAVGSRVAVVGTGTLSLVATQVLAAYSPSELVLIGDSPSGRELGIAWGATRCVSNAEALEPGWTCEADVVFEAGSRPTSAKAALAASRRGATVVLEGIPGEPAAGDLTDIVLKHLSVQGVFGASAAAWEHVVTMFNAGLLDLAPLVSHRYAVTDVASALATLRARPADLRKVLLLP
ncbi:zinc-dependent alcohol dehydrogenase [Actinopolymorpha pittospori]|uniref:Threonine dehydrogenase-like Zn-dependent dehydrogenase n=1 Tax=Actinopolymorpha pittospori TaxID=648752 RepID=A0A927RHR4_9ACTN|nr:alcohol dehydrogenase catalytic domain-containing protein [Actinopolymorpha pittospori]MBE1612495.1 threonine dehydrogenase-like Zn-dependent dehydrogenase [Actinopolymorpha pittospori]